MNSEQKMIAAAQRAARRMARAEGMPYQASLDRVAREAGRPHWRAFRDDPAPVDDLSRTTAEEPDFSRTDGTRHLDLAVAYGRLIDAATMVARSKDDGEPALSYVVSGSPREQGVDARGLSLDAMVAALAHLADATGAGVLRCDDVDLPFRVSDDRVATGPRPRIVVAVDGRSTIGDVASSVSDGIRVEDGPAVVMPRREETLFSLDVPFRSRDDHSLLDLLVATLFRLPGSYVRVTDRKARYDVHLVHDGRERLVHHGAVKGYDTIVAMAKERCGLDPAERRSHQKGSFIHRDDDREVAVHVLCEARADGMQIVRIGLAEHAPPAPVRGTDSTGPDRDDGVLLGRTGMLTWRAVRALPGHSTLVVGYPGSGKTREVVRSAILDAGDADVVVHDQGGRIVAQIGDRLARSRVLTLDPVSDVARFNPLHPDMMPEGHLAAARAMSDVLYPKRRNYGGYWEEAASALFAGLVDVVAMAPGLVARSDGTPRPVSLPAVSVALRMVEAGRMLERDVLDEMISKGADHGYGACRNLMGMSKDVRGSVILATRAGLAFLDHQVARRWTSPTNGDDGSSLAKTLSSDGPPATILTSGLQDHEDKGVLASLVIDAAVRIRGAKGEDARPMHVHLDDFPWLAPMGWTDRVLSHSGRAPSGVSTTVVCQALSQIYRMSPSSDPGASMWFDNVLVLGHANEDDLWRLMREFPGAARMADMQNRIPAGGRLLLSHDGLRMLRR